MLGLTGMASADQITFSNGLSPMVFTGGGTSTTMSFGGGTCAGGIANCTSGSGLLDLGINNPPGGPPTGTFTLSFNSTPTLGAQQTLLPGVSYYSGMAGATMNFTFNVGSDYLNGTITLKYLTVDGNQATLNATFLPTGASTNCTGANCLATLWNLANPTATNMLIDLTTDGTSIDNAYNNGTSVQVSNMSGHIYPPVGPPPPVPEPASIAMIGSGLLALGGVIRRRLGK
jgi:hypothetical protein